MYYLVIHLTNVSLNQNSLLLLLCIVKFFYEGFGNDQDIEMETEQPEQSAEGGNDADEQPPSPTQDTTPQVNGEEKGEGKTATAARKVTLSYEKYRRIANTLILFMRQEEDKISSSKFKNIYINIKGIVYLSPAKFKMVNELKRCSIFQNK